MAKKLKDYFDKELLVFLSNLFKTNNIPFDAKSFQKKALREIEAFELKGRVKVIAQYLYDFVPGDYNEKTATLIKVLGPENESDLGTFNNYFWTWPIAAIVEHHGLEYRKASLELIYEITKRGTGEFAIRQFIEQDPDYLYKVMNKWSKDSNFHVRRLSSEGWRPKLPWAKKLDVYWDNPSPMFDVLTRLNNDPSRYVQNSVANHMGDWLKIDKERASNVLMNWANTTHANTKWIIRHSIRNLRKKEDAWALDLTEKMR